MEKISFNPSETKSFLDSIVKSLSIELTEKISQNIEHNWIADYVYASVTENNVFFEIEYHPYNSSKTNLVVMKPNHNDQTQNIEQYILGKMDFCTIENEAYNIYNESFA